MSKDIVIQKVLQRVETSTQQGKMSKQRHMCKKTAGCTVCLGGGLQDVNFSANHRPDNRPFLRAWPYQQSMVRGYDHGNL